MTLGEGILKESLSLKWYSKKVLQNLEILGGSI
jgi:hypothetical protein